LLHHDGKYADTGVGVKTTIKKSGDSAAVRIPASAMQAVGLNLDDTIDICEEAGPTCH
jgi:hypothetical protein